MCGYFDPAVTEQCTEDDAEEVREKIRANFCDYFKPGQDTFDPAGVAAQEQARTSLDSLFGGAEEEDGQGGSEPGDAEDLFR